MGIVLIVGGASADWVIACATIALVVATLALAIVAAFQDRIRSRLWHPRLDVSIEAATPDCLKIPLGGPPGTGVDSIYLRLRVSNSGDAQAEQAEVYAQRLEQRVGTVWARVATFLPMNLKWSNTAGFPPLDQIRVSIAPGGVFRHCDIGRIADPARRHQLSVQDYNPGLGLTHDQTSLAFDTVVTPAHLGHIVPPGDYRLSILVGAANAPPITRCVSLHIRGTWFADEATMLANGIAVGVSDC